MWFTFSNDFTTGSIKDILTSHLTCHCLDYVKLNRPWTTTTTLLNLKIHRIHIIRAWRFWWLYYRNSVKLNVNMECWFSKSDKSPSKRSSTYLVDNQYKPNLTIWNINISFLENYYQNFWFGARSLGYFDWTIQWK